MKDYKKFLSLIFSLLILASFNNYYSQENGFWRETDTLKYKRTWHTSIKLNTGRILVIGGSHDDDADHGIKNCEIYDPYTNTWSEIAPMKVGRTFHASVKLHNGNVLVCGGYESRIVPYYIMNHCEVYDNFSDSWFEIDTMTVRRVQHEVVTLNDGRVLIVGGRTTYGSGSFAEEDATETCEIFDPTNEEWKLTGSLNEIRTGHRATLLPNGKVLVTGGNYWGGPPNKTCEIFDPITEEWFYAAPMNVGRNFHSAILLNNDKVLVIGGNDETCEVYDYITDSWSLVRSANVVRTNDGSAVKMNNGNVFVTTFRDSLCEIYDSFKDEWYFADTLPVNSSFGTLTTLDDDRILLSGGNNSDRASNRCFLFIRDSTTTVDEHSSSNNFFQLYQNYPNPFNSSTTILFEIPNEGLVTIKIYDLLGQNIATIVNNILNPGMQKVNFDASYNADNRTLASGTYIYTMQIGPFSKSSKMSLIK